MPLLAAFRWSGSEMVRSCSDWASHVCSWSFVGAPSAECKPLTVAVHILGPLGSAEWWSGPLRPQHLLRETMGAEPRRPPTRAQHRPSSRHTQCYQEEQHLRKTKRRWMIQESPGKILLIAGKNRNNSSVILWGRTSRKFHNCQTLACQVWL